MPLFRLPAPPPPTEFSDPKAADLAHRLEECVDRIMRVLPFAAQYGIKPDAFKAEMAKELLAHQAEVPALYEKCKAILAQPLKDNGAENVVQIVEAVFDSIYPGNPLKFGLVGSRMPWNGQRWGGGLRSELYKPHVNPRLPLALEEGRKALGEGKPQSVKKG